MARSDSIPPVSICVLTYGDYAALAERCLESIRRCCERSLYRLIFGANAVGQETRQYLKERLEAGDVDRLHLSDVNLNKCPMMRRMFVDVDTEFIWWFDDDSYVVGPEALPRRLMIARAAPTTVAWGHKFFFSRESDFNLGLDAVALVKRAPWYRGRPPASWE